MLITNQTAVDYWFGPMHLLAGVGETLILDDTSDTSLYLIDDTVADAVNTLVQSGMIAVTLANTPFPRPTGTPDLLHGDGSPQGKVYGGQGSVYLRRDNTSGQTALFVKTSGVTFNTGWAAINDPWNGLGLALGLQASTFPLHMANNTGALTTGQVWACGVWLNAGTTLTTLVANVTTAGTGLSYAALGLYSYNGSTYSLAAYSAGTPVTPFQTTGFAEVAISTSPGSYTVPTSGLYYLACLTAGGTPPALAYNNGAGSAASQQIGGQYPYFQSSTSGFTSLPSSVTPAQTAQAVWLGAN